MDEKLQKHISDTNNHINLVRNYLLFTSKILHLRGVKHDASKLQEPEQEIFIEYGPKLKDSTYGSEEYKTFLKEMKPALDHHYGNNRHHPEYHKNGIADMNLIDVLEMFFDWMAATKRHDNGDIYKSVDLNKDRFKYDDTLASIFKNTAKYIEGWSFDLIEELLKTAGFADNENVRTIVYDWFTQQCVSCEEYKNKCNDEDFYAAEGIILTLVSMGLG